jgi:uracil phosphoribosyltransferase
MDSTPAGVTVIDHPLVRTKLTRLRDKNTPSEEFRRLVREVAALMAFEATRTLETVDLEIETPLARYAGKKLSRPVVIAPILRAGLGFSDGIAAALPDAAVGHIGIYRNEETALPESYYFKMPPHVAQSDVLVVDPMLATGGSSVSAIEKIKELGVTRIRFVCLVSCPEGIKKLRDAHPDVPIFTAEIDEKLDARSYIVPGLGDAGDRYFGT